MVIQNYGGPEQLKIEKIPAPEPKTDEVLIQVKAFGLNRAEIYFRKGLWGEVAKVSGIECVGLVAADPAGRFLNGQKVLAILGGMGRTINGSYAEFTRVPASNVVAIESKLDWPDLAAIPESYATAWSCLFGNLGLEKDQKLLIRGATSALGQAALNIAAESGVLTIATTRNPKRFALLEQLGASDILLEDAALSSEVRSRYPARIDAVYDLVGNSTLLDSLRMVRRNGRVCSVGVLGGGAPIEAFNPLMQMPSAVHLSVFGSAFVLGSPQFPLSDIPFQTIVDRVAAGTYKAKPAKVFQFEEIQAAHRLMESNEAGGKIVVAV
ncbi:MAG: zinc-binding dehydrogenase [Verrucomicrobia bacterium]|nr:zinc-binding dehydrogenase [Verrucomicrobiota bacterium]